MTSRPRLNVGTSDGLHILGTPGRSVDFEGRAVRAMARHADARWALVDESEVWSHQQAGTWEQAASLPDGGAQCLASDGRALWIGGASAQLWRLEDGQLDANEAFEHAPTRDEWFTPWGGPPAVRSIDGAPDGTLYVNVHVGGVLRSDDGGASWQETIDLRSDVHQVIYHAQTGLLLAACGRGLARSDDRGANWQYETEGLHGTYLRAVAVAGEALLVTASDGPHGSRAAVYRKRLATDEPFERCRSGLPEWFDHNLNTHCLIASGSELALGSRDGRVFTSQDQGESWEILAEDLPRIECLAWG